MAKMFSKKTLVEKIAADLTEMLLDLASGKLPGVEAHDDVVEAVVSALTEKLQHLFAFLFAVSFSFAFAHPDNLHESSQLGKAVDSVPFTS